MRGICSCFGLIYTKEEEEEEERMEGGEEFGSDNEGNSEEFSSSDTENEEVETEVLERERGLKPELLDGMFYPNRDLQNEGSDDLQPTIGCSRSFDRYASSSSGKGLSDEQIPLEETSLGLERVNFDRDFQHKRAKVNYSSMDCRFTPLAPRIPDTSSLEGAWSSFDPSEKDMVLYLNLMPDDDSTRSIIDHVSEDQLADNVIRMDLTDDLLHMVFSFLDHINLCRAAMVCRQWRSASSHDDFWRCLNFEERNISAVQCESSVHLTVINANGCTLRIPAYIGT